MGKLPTQLKWSRFKCILERLGYAPNPPGGGSARSFYRLRPAPEVVTFHQPHGSDTIKLGTLTEYIRKLKIDRNEFLRHHEEC